MKVLITGICGFAGCTLAMEWLAADRSVKVYGIDNLIRPGSETNVAALRKRGVAVMHGDIRCASDFESLPAVEWVVDAAANASVLAGVDGTTSSRQLIEHNLLGTVNILEFCKRHKAGFTLLSSSRVYSIPPLAGLPVKVQGNAFVPDDACGLPPGISTKGVSELFSTTPPVSLYGSTKLASELLALEYGESFDFPVFVNRCGVLAGAGQFGRGDQGIFSYWIHSCAAHRSLKYIGFGGNGYQVRDCLHPADLGPLVRKQIAVAEAPPARVVNLGGGTENSMSLAGLSAWCEERFGKQDIAVDLLERPFDIPWMVMDCSLAARVWQWQPETALLRILEEIAEHARHHPGWLDITGG